MRRCQHHPSQIQPEISSSASPTTDSNNRLGCHFVVVCHLADTHRSPIEHLLETKPNKIRVTGSSKAREKAMAHSATYEEILNIRYQMALHSLCSRRKASTPIGALPPELLRVFHFCPLEEQSCSDVQRLGWAVVTQVYQRWGQGALDDSSLWARITGSSPHAGSVSQTLVRTRNAPLYIDLMGVPHLKVLSKLSRTSLTPASSGSTPCLFVTLIVSRRFAH